MSRRGCTSDQLAPWRQGVVHGAPEGSRRGHRGARQGLRQPVLSESGQLPRCRRQAVVARVFAGRGPRRNWCRDAIGAVTQLVSSSSIGCRRHSVAWTACRPGSSPGEDPTLATPVRAAVLNSAAERVHQALVSARRNRSAAPQRRRESKPRLPVTVRQRAASHGLGTPLRNEARELAWPGNGGSFRAGHSDGTG